MLSDEEYLALKKRRPNGVNWIPHQGNYKLTKLATDVRGDAPEVVVWEREVSQHEVKQMAAKSRPYGVPKWVDPSLKVNKKFESSAWDAS